MSSNGSRILEEVQLCTTCRGIFEKTNPDLYDLQPHHSSKQELEHAAYQGCLLCTAFLSKTQAMTDPADSRLDGSVFWTVFFDNDGSSSMSVSLSDER